MSKDKYLRRHFYMDEDSLKSLSKLEKKYKKTGSMIVRNLLNKRASLKTLKFLEEQIKTNKRAQLLVSRLPNNINQIAHNLNEGAHNFDEYKFYEITEEFKDEVKELIFELRYNTRLLEEII
ncbi:hypothetical protein CPU12_01215 [Malaciobacter molluscorum LMG 25693]|uniref:Mobilization protein MobC n=1 Tax=Malaciobacter molluscorum LMG 25693 TaxID=870501 RepID=A0A2G1DLQ3_9BACT|nr:plasmid mobilization relaxosome protein MobC [Malaciobacter molluscorum]AXX92199.1 putative mobilization protein MobC [Malaciobacter molluscorum LMG 25693]PHO19427.1 hypothetical protein CPU12_01215 [Malaciobacter molluscorum LMG 25693]